MLLISIHFYGQISNKKEEVPKLKQVLENCIFETCAPTGVQVKNRKRGYFTKFLVRQPLFYYRIVIATTIEYVSQDGSKLFRRII